MTKLPKIVILGHGRSGKDTVAEYMAEKYGFRFMSSSMFVARSAIWPACDSAPKPPLPAYASFDEFYADRHNHRATWFKLISDYNRDDPARLGMELFAKHDLYVGLRSAREFHALRTRHAFDFVVWVDAGTRIKPEGADSCTVEPWMSDYVIDNAHTIQGMRRSVDALMSLFGVRVRITDAERDTLRRIVHSFDGVGS